MKIDWVAIIAALLGLISWIAKTKLDQAQRKEIARAIDKASVGWSAADIDDGLRGHYRDDHRPPDADR